MELPKTLTKNKFIVVADNDLVGMRVAAAIVRRYNVHEALVADKARLVEAVEGLLDGLGSNADPESCGISWGRWNARVAEARAALDAVKGGE